MPVVQMSDSELELMKIIWGEGGTALYAVIMERLAAAGKPWQKNTVITLLSRLTEKGFLETRKIGRRNEYAAAVTEEAYRTAQARTLLNKFYEGSAKGLVSALIQTKLLSEADYEELRQFWDKGMGRDE